MGRRKRRENLFFFFFKRFYLFMRHTQRGRHRQREKQAPCREPDVGLDPRTPGSHPGPKAGTQPLSHPGFL